MEEYKFLEEVRDVDLDDYIGLIGWIGNKPKKIYASSDYQSFFLHDEIIDRFFKFEAELASVRGKGKYGSIIRAYEGCSQKKRVL
ncbi:hypothetical protein [Dyadobacter sandarakinus]|uniref:Uncharacterized protein n=1 Tax=Dyadobacter sandarakinus TaxID=2747268 RepID=A0ABX7I8H0_9BACT|nr:hypothetical protein [Dyadobacter sandarakinus]QRR01473.1 hypothetical protein HWI92_11440 [Dyadobacter sandarakinus]